MPLPPRRVVLQMQYYSMIQQSVRAALSGADMVVFAAPIYWFDISAQLKLALDACTPSAAAGSISRRWRCCSTRAPRASTMRPSRRTRP
ncbi:hypothetical protein ET524_02265 [Senegalimassilia faecalis]|uniref:NADPH-dependent FMN reductase-like domain-containing protein n=1 Tax=Senegalimassilia faecalis TaxID=2509433 RepID=A0A4Q2JZM6_9ACTN|nr:hypothetical protein ET524_02265 [Senegalimassilia faecalis]